MSLTRSDIARLAGAALLAVSAGVHFRLLRGGYRDIHVDSVLGIDLSRSFVIAVVAGVALSLLLVASVIWDFDGRLIALAGAGYALGAIVAYALSRTSGFLGFEESEWVTEAVLAKPVELLAAVALTFSVVRPGRRAAVSPAV